MKKFNILLFLLPLMALSSCGRNNTISSYSSSSDETSTSKISSSSNSTSTDGKVYDTSGNEITSGYASISFKYGHQSTSKTISAAYLIDGVTVNITSGEYISASSSSNQVIFLVTNGGTLNITGSSSSRVVLTKSGSGASDGQVGDDYSFYGINSGIVVAGSSSSATICYADITTSSNGSNAVVSTNGGSLTIKNSTIKTTASASSRGLHATYDGSITADNVSITTQGVSCASIATDRGGGTITASNMTLETNSNGSPLIYSTDSITVSDSTGSANNAQMVVVEGGSSATLTNCNFSCTGKGNRSGTSDSNSSTHTIDAGGIFIYQSFSGDSSEGIDYFAATNCTFKVTTSGTPMFYLTNITAEISLTNNTLTQASSSDYLLVAEATSEWGSSGSNGASVTVKLSNQDWTKTNTYVGSTSSVSYK